MEAWRRVDRAAGDFHRRWLELLADEAGEALDVHVRLDGGVVSTAAVGAPDVQWLQHVHGLRAADTALAGELLGWYRHLGVRPRFELAADDGFEALADVLHGGGARQVGFVDLLVGSPSAPGERPHASHVDVRRLAAQPDERFGATLVAGHEPPAPSHQAHLRAAARFPTLEGCTCYLAEDSVTRRPLGAAVLVVHGGVGLLANASVLPVARRRGVQAALVARRLADAHEAGCEVAGALALPWSTSQRNLRRAGLAVATTKVDWVVAEAPR